MLTKAKIEIYKHYNGDDDMFARSARKREKAAISDGDWGMIASFVQDIKLVKANLAAASYQAAVEQKLRECCDQEQTFQLITDYAVGEMQPKKDNWFKKILNLFK
jgi:hypothetical protein